MDTLKRVNRTKVTPELLGEVMHMHAILPAADRASPDARTIRMFELLKARGAGNHLTDLALAINLRLAALAGLLARQEVRGWTIAGDKVGRKHVHADLVQMAAEEPVIEGANGQAAFNVESFRIRLLGIAKPQGQA
jgi:hypothetical protein